MAFMCICIKFSGPPCIRGESLIAIVRFTFYTRHSSLFIRCGTILSILVDFRATWHRFVRRIASATIERRRSRGHVVHAINKSRTWFKKDLSESRSTVHLKSYNGHD